jgi:hypothetical protein
VALAVMAAKIGCSTQPRQRPIHTATRVFRFLLLPLPRFRRPISICLRRPISDRRLRHPFCREHHLNRLLLERVKLLKNLKLGGRYAIVEDVRVRRYFDIDYFYLFIYLFI